MSRHTWQPEAAQHRLKPVPPMPDHMVDFSLLYPECRDESRHGTQKCVRYSLVHT